VLLAPSKKGLPAPALAPLKKGLLALVTSKKAKLLKNQLQLPI
jgi:hypothetical protein